MERFGCFDTFSFHDGSKGVQQPKSGFMVCWSLLDLLGVVTCICSMVDMHFITGDPLNCLLSPSKWYDYFFGMIQSWLPIFSIEMFPHCFFGGTSTANVLTWPRWLPVTQLGLGTLQCLGSLVRDPWTVQLRATWGVDFLEVTLWLWHSHFAMGFRWPIEIDGLHP